MCDVSAYQKARNILAGCNSGTGKSVLRQLVPDFPKEGLGEIIGNLRSAASWNHLDDQPDTAKELDYAADLLCEDYNAQPTCKEPDAPDDFVDLSRFEARAILSYIAEFQAREPFAAVASAMAKAALTSMGPDMPTDKFVTTVRFAADWSTYYGFTDWAASFNRIADSISEG